MRFSVPQQGFQFCDGCQTQFIIHAGESFAFVKGFPVAVVGTMVVFAKDRIFGEFPCQKTACQRYTGNDANIFFLGGREQFFYGFLAEHIENHFHSGNVVFHSGNAFGYFFDADAIVSNFACCFQIFQRVKNFVFLVNRSGRAVEQHQIQFFHAQTGQTAVSEADNRESLL